MSNSRRSSDPDVELPEIAGSKAKHSKDRFVPLLQEHPEHAPRARRPHANFGFFRRYLYGKNLMLYICLGILALCLIVLVLYFVFESDDSIANYKVTHTTIASNQNSYSALLEWNGGIHEDELPYITKNRIAHLSFSMYCYTPTHFRFIITDKDHTRWEIPGTDPYSHLTNSTACNYNDTDVSFSVQEHPFSLRIWRKSTQEVLFDMKDLPLVFAENYIEITTHLASLDFYGLGERLYKFQMGNGTYTIWPYDQAGDIESGKPGHNLYGQQPMYLLRESTGDYHIVLLRNSNAMDIQISEDKKMKYQVVGGVLDFNIFIGSKDPESVIEAYHDYVGNWMVPPFWSMGFHQSKWGYNNISDFTNVLQNFQDYNIPLDVIWSDIDYMIEYIGFTIDTTRYPIDELKATLEQYDKRWVPIMDAGIGVVNNSENIAYTIGLERDVFLKENDGDVLLGTVWPGTSAFPDFFHPNTSTYWADMLENMYSKVPFDGVWLDMNEISNFCDTQECLDKVISPYTDLPVLPGARRIDNKTLPLDAVHYGGVQEFNAHSLFNLLESKVTYDYLKTKSPMPFILTRANIFGSGKYASHWFGDTRADWISMRYTIGSLLNYNLFGIPHSGADICGFMEATTPELCTRWTQLGAFYPFARNHHELFTARQEPFHFDDPYRTAMIEAIRFRYSIIKHFYTLFVSKNGKGTVVKPLFFEFPNDTNLFNFSIFTEEQFMVGEAIMVAPVLYEKQTQVQVYFPAESWYSLLTYQQVKGLAANRNLTINAPLESMIPTYIRGGNIVMVQDSSTVMSTRELTNEFSMVVAFNDKASANADQKATGEILDVVDHQDATIYEKCIMKNCVLELDAELKWDAANSKLTLTVEANRRTTVDPAGDTGYVDVKTIRILASALVDIDTAILGEVSLTNEENPEAVSVVQVSKEGDSVLLTLEASITLKDDSKIVIKN